MRLDGKLLAVVVCLLLIAGVATAENPATTTKTEKVTEEAAKTEEAVQAEKAEKTEETEQVVEAAQTQKTEQAEQPMKAAKAQKAEKAEHAEKPAKAAQAQKAEKPTKTAQAPDAPRKQAETNDGMSISRIAICEDVQERVPVGESETFSSGIGQLWCFTRVMNAAAPTQIYHRWYVGDEMVDEIAINVGGKQWRCWSTKTILPSWTGSCRVEILTEEGDVISTKEFVLEG